MVEEGDTVSRSGLKATVVDVDEPDETSADTEAGEEQETTADVDVVLTDVEGVDTKRGGLL